MKNPSENSILRIAIPTPLRSSFDYLCPENINPSVLKPGIRISAPFGRKQVTGLLLETTNHSDFDYSKLKTATSILDPEPILSNTIMQLNHWTSRYYQHPIGEVMLGSLPKLLRQGRLITDPPSIEVASDLIETPSNIELNSAQAEAVNKVIANPEFQTYLLDGVTGSGKTEVYLHIIEDMLQRGLQAMVLVPEIGLTPQTVARFTQRFNVPVAVFHSKLNDTERLNAWLQAKSGAARIIIGTRSSIFTPLAQPGIIILDEAHDLSFKQQSGLRYSARDLAIMRGKLENFPVVLGTATPSLESINNVKRQRYTHLHLPERAGTAVHPNFNIIDIRNQRLQEGLSSQLIAAIEKHLNDNNQVLIFLNRRGFAPTLLCHSCGWIAECSRCDARYAYHQNQRQLICHHCGSFKSLPRSCPECNTQQLLLLGAGTERLEEFLQRHFPTYETIRIDRDSTRRKGSMEKLLKKVQNGHQQILIGTQMLAKGHHFPNVTLVTIIDVDSGFYSVDFRANERMAQLILQVAGRAGRAEKPGEVYLQTHHPENPQLVKLINEGYQSFAETALAERAQANLPPQSFLALLRADALKADDPTNFLQQVKEQALQNKPVEIELFGPIPAAMEKRAGRYRAQLLVQAPQRQMLQQYLNQVIPKIEALKSARKVRWSIDVDPLDML